MCPYTYQPILTYPNFCKPKRERSLARGHEVVKVVEIQERILTIRNRRVILDADLAAFYGVPTKRLNEQVKRNANRFPDDFVFRLSSGEKAEVVANCDHLNNLKFSRTLPFAFSEHGAIMAASVLSSERAVNVSVFVVRAFVALRTAMVTHKEFARRFTQLEKHLANHDEQILLLVKAIKELMDGNADQKSRRIGFVSEPTANSD